MAISIKVLFYSTLFRKFYLILGLTFLARDYDEIPR
jgi:hypothetical protein